MTVKSWRASSASSESLEAQRRRRLASESARKGAWFRPERSERRLMEMTLQRSRPKRLRKDGFGPGVPGLKGRTLIRRSLDHRDDLSTRRSLDGLQILGLHIHFSSSHKTARPLSYTIRHNSLLIFSIARVRASRCRGRPGFAWLNDLVGSKGAARDFPGPDRADHPVEIDRRGRFDVQVGGTRRVIASPTDRDRSGRSGSCPWWRRSCWLA